MGLHAHNLRGDDANSRGCGGRGPALREGRPDFVARTAIPDARRQQSERLRHDSR